MLNQNKARSVYIYGKIRSYPDAYLLSVDGVEKVLMRSLGFTNCFPFGRIKDNSQLEIPGPFLAIYLRKWVKKQKHLVRIIF